MFRIDLSVSEAGSIRVFDAVFFASVMKFGNLLEIIRISNYPETCNIWSPPGEHNSFQSFLFILCWVWEVALRSLVYKQEQTDIALVFSSLPTSYHCSPYHISCSIVFLQKGWFYRILLAMLCFPVVGLLLVSFAPTVLSQEPLETATQTLVGTWSSGSKNVITGSVSFHEKLLLSS